MNTLKVIILLASLSGLLILIGYFLGRGKGKGLWMPIHRRPICLSLIPCVRRDDHEPLQDPSAR
jgi:hypothetical protein